MTTLRARLADALEDAQITGHTFIAEDGYLSVAIHDDREAAERAVDILLSLPGIAIIELPNELPTVAYKGPHDTDASLFRGAADRLDSGYELGGSNVKRAVSQLLRAAANAAEQASDGR